MRWLLRLRVCIIITLAIMLIVVAVAFGLLRAFLPYATGYKTEIETAISQQIGLPVRIERIDADINWFSPRLDLLQITVYNSVNKVPLFHFRKLLFELDTIHSLLRRELVVGDISLVGIDISIEKQMNKRWLVQGIEIEDSHSTGMMDKLMYTLLHADYSLIDSNIYYRDMTKNGFALNLLDVNVNVENYRNAHHLELSMKLPENFGQHLHVIANLQGEFKQNISGNFYIDAKAIKIKQWMKKFNQLPDYKLDGVVDTTIWGTLHNNKLTQIITRLSATELSIANAMAKKRSSSVWEVDKLSTSLRLTKIARRWHINVSDLEMEQAGKPLWPQAANIIASYGAEELYVNASFLRLQDIIKITDILAGDKIKSTPLDKMKLTGDVYNLQLSYIVDAADKDRLRGDFINLGMRLENIPASVSGVDANVRFNNNKINLKLLSKQVIVSLKKLFRDPLQADVLTGDAVIKLSKNFLNDHAWSLSAPLLHIKNRHIDTWSRLRLNMPAVSNVVVAKTAQDVKWQNKNKTSDTPPANGSSKSQLKPPSLFIDMQTSFYNAYTKYTSHYLPVGIMSPALVNWLDSSIHNGYVRQGAFILYGNVADFPYHNGEGVMEVLFHPTDISLKFLDNWPVIYGLSADIKFYNNSMFITNASGKSKRAYLAKVNASIVDLKKPLLKINAKAIASIQDLQAYIWSCPLDDFLGNTFRLFQLDGKTVLDLALNIPLYEDNIIPTYSGKLAFDHSSWYYPQLDYSLKNINGSFSFTQNSITGNNVSAYIDGSALNISARTINQRNNPEVIVNIKGPINIDTLLGSYKWIPDNWLSGKSPWNISIKVPFHPEDYLVHVDAGSSLKGVSIAMSDVVSKSAKKSIPVKVSIDVLDDDILHLGLTAKDILSLNVVRDNTGLISFNIHAPLISGKGSFAEGFDKDTTVQMNFDTLNLSALLVSAGNTYNNGEIKPQDFPPLDLQAKKLYWNHWKFNHAVLKTDWQQQGMLIEKIKLNGPAMSLNAKGTWLTGWLHNNKTTLSGGIHSDDMGKTLTGLGFEKSIDKSKFDATFNADWLAEPYLLSWKNVNGDAEFKLQQGVIPNVNPGASGRLLGLMNIFQITNRLALNFKDVYRKGFVFDKIDGRLDFSHGKGKLSAFEIKAPAADIKMSGNLGLVKHNYDLLMRVKPNAGGITFAGATLLGGVVVGAGLALIQKALNISLIKDDVYTITGKWDKPLIQKIINKGNTPTDDEVNDEGSF